MKNENLKNKVIFYGTGEYARSEFNKLNIEYSPVAFCDSDERKSGSTFLNLPVLSFDEVLLKYPDCIFLITTSEGYKWEITNTLINKGILPERIINYEKRSLYFSCNELETTMIIYESSLWFCCTPFGRVNPPIVKIGESNKETLENYITMREKTINELNVACSSETFQNSTPPPFCFGCSEVKEWYWADKKTLRLLYLGFSSLCNIKCTYCVGGIHKSSAESIQSSTEKVLSFFNYLEECNFIDKNTTIQIAYGEITVHPYKEKILSAIKDYPVNFYINALIYDDEISEILAMSRSKITSSVDCGTRETFASIKGVDAYDKVCENLYKYSKDGNVILKWITLPGVNDNINDVNGFIALCKKCNIKNVTISRDYNDANAYQDNTIKMIAMLIYGLREEGVIVFLPERVFLGTDDYKKINEVIKQIELDDSGK